MAYPLSVHERFWAKVEKAEGCWNWIAGKRSTGYGELSVSGRPQSAHRLSWEFVNGPIPPGLCVLHRCDNRACVRPEHLFLGTRGDNNRDTHTKGRWHYVPAGSGKKRLPSVARRGPDPSPIADRFWAKVDRRGPDECWPWTAGRHPTGYGRFFMPGRPRQNNREAAHRIAYLLANGDLPVALHVLHSCDNPPCCNPAHLRVGTNADNIADRTARGRGALQDGERNGNAKLSDGQVAEIRRRYKAGGVSQETLASEFGVKQPQISRLVRGEQRKG